MGEVVENLVENGHRFEDILHTYTVDQVWLFYDKSILIRRKKQHEDAMLLAHVVSLPYGGKEAHKNFTSYVKQLLPKHLREAIRKDKKRTAVQQADPQKAFQALGLPIRPPPGGSKKPKKPTATSKKTIPKIDDI